MQIGRCLCGEVRWRVTGELRPLNYCHCSMCRKAHGASYVTFTGCAEDAFEWVQGAENIAEYSVAPTLIRRFCFTCGSAVPGSVPDQRRVFLPAGTFEGDPGQRPRSHTFVADKAPWVAIPNEAEKHAAYPSTSVYAALPVFDRDVEGEAPAGIARGSCLCGAVGFEVTLPFLVVHNCHCTRCRHARGAAHATNGFVQLDALRVTRGEDLITDYKLPEAKAFGQAFCTTCGSATPRRILKAGVASIPFGALDDDPGQGPMDHIYVGSMAEWHEIWDGLPQFDELPV